ncbi:MAG TPA: ABC transporter permease [Bacilli bacterium]|nr:ABC transporter permease [Bacilli bacterium]
MLTIIRKEVLLLLKEKGTFFWLFLLPILFIVMFASVFGNIGGQDITIQYLDQDDTQASHQFLDAIKELKGFTLESDNDLTLDEQVQQIKDGKQSSLLVIPSGFEKELQASAAPANIELYRDATADDAVAPVQAVLQNIANGYREGKISGTLQGLGKTDVEIQQILTPPIAVKEVKENASKADMVSQVVPGYTVMFVFFIIISMVRSFIKEKESGMLARLRSTPLKPLSYLMGTWVSFILVALIQCGVLLAFGHFVYDLQLGDVLAVSLIVLCLSICGTGIGLALSMLVKSENQGVAFTQILTMGGAVVGGLWFPYDFLPRSAQVVGLFTPQYWAQHGFQDVMIRGAHLTDVWPTLLVLIGFGVLGLLVALARYRKFMLTASN